MSYCDTLFDEKSAITALLTDVLIPDDINPFGEKPIENLTQTHTHTPVSYTHLTLPTKRIV